MRTVILCLALLFAAAAELAAQGGCRRHADYGTLRDKEAVVHVARGDHATIDFTALGRNATLAIQGIVCDPSGRPVPGLGVTLVRYQETEAAKGQNPSASDLENRPDAYKVLGRSERATSREGHFRFLGVNPGESALQVDWDKLPPNIGQVIFDLNWVDSVPLGPGYDGG